MRGSISIGALIVMLAAMTAANAQNPSQAQPQLDTPQKQDLPIDHEKERARDNAKPLDPGETKGATTGSKPGRVPEHGQAMGMAPSEPDSADARNVGDLPGVSPETVPAKFSAAIFENDKIKTTERPLALTDAQKSLILQRLSETKTSPAPAPAPDGTSPGLFAETGSQIPYNLTPQEIPQELQANVPALKGLKYVKKDRQVLLVMPSNGIVRNVLQ